MAKEDKTPQAGPPSPPAGEGRGRGMFFGLLLYESVKGFEQFLP